MPKKLIINRLSTLIRSRLPRQIPGRQVNSMIQKNWQIVLYLPAYRLFLQNTSRRNSVNFPPCAMGAKAFSLSPSVCQPRVPSLKVMTIFRSQKYRLPSAPRSCILPMALSISALLRSSMGRSWNSPYIATSSGL